MSKYGTFKYAEDTYGDGRAAPIRWGFIVKWDGKHWCSTNEANKMVSLTVRRGRRSMIAAGGRGFASFQPGEATAIFDNTDGRYDPYNASSPIYGHITPGKFVRISVRDEDENVHQVMRGIIASITPVPKGRTQQVRIRVVDGLQWLKDRTINVGLQTDIAKSEVPVRIIDAVDWPHAEWPGWVVPDAATLDYWWAWNQNAFEALDEFNQAELAVAFHDREGFLVWYPKDYQYYRTLTFEQDQILEDIARPQPWDVVRNKVRISTQTKVLDSINAILWQLRDTPAILDGATFYVEPIFKYAEWQPCGASITFNHTVNAEAGGGGADLTSSCPLTYDAQIGEGAEITITNNSGSTGYITLLKATGDAIYAPSVTIREAEDTTSQTAYGPRTFSIDSRWVEDSGEAQLLADYVLSLLKDPTMQPTIQIEHRSGLQFYLDLQDRIILNMAHLGLDGEMYRIGHIEHQTIGDNCQQVRTVFRLEPYNFYTVPADTWIFPADFEVNTNFGA